VRCFVELGREAKMMAAMARVEREEKGWDGTEKTFIQTVTEKERLMREDAEVIKVTDDSSAERVLELLDDGVVIQDEALNGGLDGAALKYALVEYTSATTEDGRTQEKIRVIPRIPLGELARQHTVTTGFTTPWHKGFPTLWSLWGRVQRS